MQVDARIHVNDYVSIHVDFQYSYDCHGKFASLRSIRNVCNLLTFYNL